MRLRYYAFVATVTAICSLATHSSFGQHPVIPGYRVSSQPAPVVSGGAGSFARAVMSAAAGPSSAAMQAAPILTTAPPSSYVAPAGVVSHISSGDFGDFGDVGCDVGCVDMIGCDGRCGGFCDECCDGGGGGFVGCWNFYGEFLYLRPRDSEIAWATPIDGPIVPGPLNTNPIQIAPYGVADMDFQPGWRGGVQYNLSECAAISTQYTMFESSTTSFVTATVPNVVRSLVSHPGTQTAAQDFLGGQASYTNDFDRLDIDYHRLLSYGCNYQYGYIAGLSVTQSQQTFEAQFAGTGTEQVATDIDFYGGGGRFGVFGDYNMDCTWGLYGNAMGNLLVGEYRADYFQGQSYDPVVVATHWQGGRIIGIWDLELGVRRTSRCGKYVFSVGYMYSAWTNTLQTDQWIQGVRNNQLVDMNSTTTYDGMVARFDVRF